MTDLWVNGKQFKPLAATIVFLTIAIYLSHAHVLYAQNSGPTAEINSIDFSNPDEAVKHLDIVTECYDSNSDGTAREYVDTSNHWFVFEGDNTDTTNGYDEPIAVFKGYGEPDGTSYYAVFPYNYTVEADFLVPDVPGYGNFFILPRYKDVSNKYEVVVDTRNSQLVFNYVKGDTWSNLKADSLGFTIEKNHWYRLIVTVSWEYNPDENKYMNHITAKIVDPSDTANSYQDDVWDDNLPPDSYNGLSFLGFDAYNKFKVYMDNVRVTMDMEEAFEEPSESISPGDLDIQSIYIASDDNMIYFKLELAGQAAPDSSNTKYWTMELDIDKDSRNNDDSWEYEYSFTVQLPTDGSARADLYDSSGNWITRLHILGGGVEYNYLIVEVNKTDLAGLGDSFYASGYTQLGNTVEDNFPLDDTNNAQSGDYVIYYLSKPNPGSAWTIVSDSQGDASPDYLDITQVKAAHNTELVFYNFTVSGIYPWYGGSASIYDIFIDADNDPGTGYPYQGIGADYMIRYQSGYVPRLYKYSGTSGGWGWTLLKREDYTYNPGGLHSVVITIPVNDFTSTPLQSTVKIVGETEQNYDTKDTTEAAPVPVPETAYLIVIGIFTALFISRRLLARTIPRVVQLSSG